MKYVKFFACAKNLYFESPFTQIFDCVKNTHLGSFYMVYTRVLIVQGIPLTREQIEKFIEIGEDDEVGDKFYDELIEGFEKNLRGYPGLRLFSFPCCSESNGKMFILGYELNSFSRRFIQCSKCEEFSLCERCIGETVYGFYDVQKILDFPQEIPKEKICSMCYSDKCVDGRCTVCFTYTKEKIPNRLSVFAKKVLGMTHTQAESSFYYMLNDCLSCT